MYIVSLVHVCIILTILTSLDSGVSGSRCTHHPRNCTAILTLGTHWSRDQFPALGSDLGSVLVWGTRTLPRSLPRAVNDHGTNAYRWASIYSTQPRVENFGLIFIELTTYI